MNTSTRRTGPPRKRAAVGSASLTEAAAVLRGLRGDTTGAVSARTAAALDAALSILDALREETDTVDEARELVRGCRRRAKELERMKLHFVAEDVPVRLEKQQLCPHCKRRLLGYIPPHCSRCGKALKAP